jgi:hypothetical protein
MMSRVEMLAEIQRCQREPVTVSSIERLACLYIVLDHMQAERVDSIADPEEKPRSIGDTDFLRCVESKDSASAWKIMDELMSVLRVTSPRLYEGVMEKLAQ